MSHPLDAFSLKGKTVMVTGASSGLGAHFAKVCSQVGARVIIGARRVEKLKELADEIRTGGGEVLAVAMDVTSRDSVEAAFDAAEKAFGVGRRIPIVMEWDREVGEALAAEEAVSSP